MKRRTILCLTCALVLVFAGVWWYFSGKRYEVIITQKRIDETLQARFPATKTHLLLLQITYSNPRVTLLPETSRIEIGLDAELNIKLGEEPKKLSGSALVTTGLSYRSETHQFFLSEPEINTLTLHGVPQGYIDKVTSLATSAAREHLQRFPIYTVEAKDIKTAAVKLLLKDVQVKSNQVHVTLGL